MLNTQIVRKATRAAQAVLTEHSPIVADGRWGSYTEKAFTSANGSVQSAIRAVTGSFGAEYTPESLRDHVRSSKGVLSVIGPDWIDAEKARALIERAANRVGLAATALQDFLDLEPVRKFMDGRTYYNVKSTNGSYKGLFQFNEDAWESAAKMEPSVGSFRNVFDPWLNTLAAAAYAKFNEREVRRGNKYTGPFTGDVYYTMHNQGAAGFIKLLKGGKMAGRQSADAVKVVERAINRTVA